MCQVSTLLVQNCTLYRVHNISSHPCGATPKPIGTKLELVQDIIKDYLCTKFHSYWSKIAPSIVYTRFKVEKMSTYIYIYYIYIYIYIHMNIYIYIYKDIWIFFFRPKVIKSHEMKNYVGPRSNFANDDHFNKQVFKVKTC